MTVWIRIGLYLFAGWLYGSGYIGDEIKHLITEDPAIVMAVETVVAAAIAYVPIHWWQLAKKFGWST